MLYPKVYFLFFKKSLLLPVVRENFCYNLKYINLIILNNTLFIGKVFLRFPVLSSTNDYALNLVSKSRPIDGTVISAAYQIAGKGQSGNIWQSQKGLNVILSIILYPSFLNARQQFLLSQAVSLAILDFISTFTPHVSIKWPNDIYIGHNKIAGILIQNSLKSIQIRSSVIGIGININQTEFKQTILKATSLKIETGNTFQIDRLEEKLCKAIEKRYIQLKAGNFKKLNEDYLEAMYLFDQMAFFQKKDKTTFKGKIIGTSDLGRLKILIGNKIQEFDSKEVVFL